MSCSIGRSDKSSITIENPASIAAMFRIENTNASAFQVMCKPTFEIRAGERRTLDILYIPSFVGQREEAIIKFNSPELGTYTYSVVGTGKPPQTFSPLIIETVIGTTSLASIDFMNPFPYKMSYSFSMTSDCASVFTLLNKKRTFTLNAYAEIRQIPFTFAPPTPGQYCADVVIMAHDDITWFFPIRATGTASRGIPVQSVTGRSRQLVTRSILFPLVGEREDFDASEYTAKFIYPRGYEFLGAILSIKPTEVQLLDGTPTLVASVRSQSRRPLDLIIEVLIGNVLSQVWNFQMKLAIASALPLETITLECGLGKVVSYQIRLNEMFNGRTACHAYFAAGSAAEFTVSEEETWIEPSLADLCELPFSVLYAPTTYGKVQRGLLVVDTLEAQWTFEFMGKSPDYVPPNILRSGRVDISLPESAKRFAEERMVRKRNIVKEGIDFIRMVRPRTSLQTRPPGLVRPIKNLNETS
jgi:hypothetical protein